MAKLEDLKFEMKTKTNKKKIDELYKYLHRR